MESNGHKGTMNPLELLDTMRSLRMEARSCRYYNEKMMMA